MRTAENVLDSSGKAAWRERTVFYTHASCIKPYSELTINNFTSKFVTLTGVSKIVGMSVTQFFCQVQCLVIGTVTCLTSGGL